jgi:hypothetical protein
MKKTKKPGQMLIAESYLCNENNVNHYWLIDLLCLTPLSAIFQQYHGDQF